MIHEFIQYFPPEVIEIALTLFLSFLLGFEREEHHGATHSRYIFGGVRTFPLIGLIGYIFIRISEASLLPLALGFTTLGIFLVFSYRQKLQLNPSAGITTEIMGLLTFLIGPLVYRHEFWLATAIVVISLLLLELREALEGLAQKIAPDEILTLSKFLLLSVVLLPIIPNVTLPTFNINPFYVWLIVVAILGISYFAYVLSRLMGPQTGLLLSAILGGAYSSTITTLSLIRKSEYYSQPKLLIGSICAAWGSMYLRFFVLLLLFKASLAFLLAPAFLILGITGIVLGTFIGKKETEKKEQPLALSIKNPLQIFPAIGLALLFLAMSILTHIIQTYWGNTGTYGFAFLSGFIDPDPFILGVARSANISLNEHTAALAIYIAALSNNLLKLFFTYTWGNSSTRRESSLVLGAYILLGAVLIPLLT